MQTKIIINALKEKDEGFTLVEVLIALSIFSIGVLAICVMQVAGTDSISASGNQLEGITWAGDRIDTLMALSYNDASLADTDNDGSTGLNDINANADGSATQGTYSVFWNIAADYPIKNTKTIRVIVSSKGRYSQTVTLDYIKTKTI